MTVKINVISIIFLLPLLFLSVAFSQLISDTVDNPEQQTLVYDYYHSLCPNAERIVFQKVQNYVAGYVRPTSKFVTAQLLRLMFHDCFTQGCDASLLLDDSNGNQSHPIERNAIPNQSLEAFDVIDTIKNALEIECPGVVSCADIMVLAARDSILLSGGPFFPLLTGRRDSLVSYFKEANNLLPNPDSNITEMLNLFSLRGFTMKETVTLLGAHNIGKISCNFLQKRVFDFEGTGKPDPSITKNFLIFLRRFCDLSTPPRPAPSRFRHLVESTTGQPNIQSPVPVIFSGDSLDSHYYKGLLENRSLLFVDQQLMADSRTAELVNVFASDDGSTFRREFAKSLLKMSNLGSANGNMGEVRKSCSLPNKK